MGKNYVWRIDIVQSLYEFYQFFLSDLLGLKFTNTSCVLLTTEHNSCECNKWDFVEVYNLSLQHCWEQKYNGANNMMGNKSVVATGLEVEQLKDLVTHC